MILAGDVGGTKTNLALFEARGRGRVSDPRAEESFGSADFPSFEEMIALYRSRHREPLEAASFGVAGPVIAGRVRGTHLMWEVDAAEVSRTLGGAPVHLLNDLAATGYSVPALRASDLAPVMEGQPDLEAHAALLAAGTGLGESLLARMGGELLPIASEGGHADFAPRTEDEIDLFRVLRARFGRVSYERVLSGPGLADLARWMHARGDGDGMAAWAAHESDTEPAELPALVSRTGLDGSCAWCARALDLFVSVFGAEAGNMALRGVTRAGVYLGGGIAPKILPALQSETFRKAFLEKEPHRDLLARIPVWAILDERAAVVGAARYATLATG